MIEILLFHAHITAAIYAFVKRWREANLKEGLLAVAMIGLVFTIGWALTGAIARVITPEGGFATWFTADTVSLLLLTIPEAVLFYFLFLKDKP